ncbi:zf-TFIIB domain-containing protein [Frigoribacterium sp. 2-23]|uniref:TFIIB-type zinc ribbon-containing protein n=1 Tax=Frigoribacterium sp. 2-23 TaxID=3415006 RepID=UPI003C6FBDE2
MKCPNDSATLVMSERSGIEIDYCPECRGVWLDRGELDKIIDRAGPQQVPPAAAAASPVAPAPPVTNMHAPYQYAEPRRDRDDRPSGRGDRDGGYRQDGYGRDGYQPDGYAQGGYRKKKKENWLSELFD